MLEGRDGIPRSLHRLESWACVNLLKFNKAKRKVLPRGWGNPKHRSRLGGKRIESSPEEKDLGVLDDKRLNTTRQCLLAALKGSHALGCIPSSVGSGRGRGLCPSAPLC